MSGLQGYTTEDILSELQRRYDCLSKPTGHYIFMGAPGSGKGTQSLALKDSHCYCHISTGDMLRSAISKNDPVGLEAKKYMDKGELVPDNVVIKLVENNINSPQCSRGFILDGFPRTNAQAKGLSDMLASIGKKIHGVFLFECSDAEIEKRITGRLVHAPSGRVYHKIFKPPKTPMKDDITNEPLIQRKDDTFEVVRTRLGAYRTQTAPLISYYDGLGLLHRLDASKPEKEVRSGIESIIVKTGDSPQ